MVMRILDNFLFKKIKEQLMLKVLNYLYLFYIISIDKQIFLKFKRKTFIIINYYLFFVYYLLNNYFF